MGTSSYVKEDSYSVEYQLNSDWGSGFTGIISITNNSNDTLEDWTLEFDFDRIITHIWGGVIKSDKGNHYIINNAGHNANIAAGQTISFGFEGYEGIVTDEPTNFNLQYYNYENIVTHNPEIKLSVNTDGLYYNESANWYVIEDEISSISGTLTDTKVVETLNYMITDFAGNIIKDGTIEVAETWTLNDFGLSIGYNKLTIIANTSDENTEYSIAFFNCNLENMNRTNIDLSDSDADGLNCYYEMLLGTNDNNADTDEDMLTDYEEFLFTGSKPTSKDTDGNGVIDSEEDPDNDGLSNLIELQLGTKCLAEDTDGDGLFDGDEVSVYLTNPLNWDTDEEGLSDAQEIELKFNPIQKDTDGDGINDNQEKVYQTYKKQILNEDRPEVISVEVSLECNGYLGTHTVIIDTYNIDMRSSEVVGLVGVPVDISADVDFDYANITFTYDENMLGDTSEDNLTMMWYDEENDKYVVLDSVTDTENNTVTFETTHFSTYLIVDKQIWLDNMRKDINYSNSDDITYYDIALVVDASKSMKGTALTKAREVLNSVIDAMLDGDRAGLVMYKHYSKILLNLTSNRDELKEEVSRLLYADGTPTDVNGGLISGMKVLGSSEKDKAKMLILICDGEGTYAESTLQTAIDRGITIHCINVVNGDSAELQKLATETGGTYYYVATAEDVDKVIDGLVRDTSGAVDMTDTDGDGLYDVYEINGMRLSNGQVVYTDPNNPDTNGDGISDYDAMGGEPVTENITLDGNTYSCTMNHSKVYGKLSSEFIYVDGTLNTDGKQYYGKMDYIPYSEEFIDKKYKKEKTFSFDGEIRIVYGDAGIYNSFSDKLPTISEAKLAEYAAVGTLTYMAICLVDIEAAWCFSTYIQGDGGSVEGLVEGSTREYINVTPRLQNNIFGINSANTYFIDNMNRARVCIESVLNEYNTEIFIALSPKTKWTGCMYNECTGDNWHQNIDSLLNMGTFGIFNVADAGVTLHCIYNPDTDEYYMEYIYYIIDLYDFTLYDMLNEMNALGLARCYELYGVAVGVTVWEKADNMGKSWIYR